MGTAQASAGRSMMDLEGVEEIGSSLSPQMLRDAVESSGAVWRYDHEVGLNDNLSRHARLRSGSCCDTFINPNVLAKYDGLRRVLAVNAVGRLLERGGVIPTQVVGIPDSGSLFRDDVNRLIGNKKIKNPLSRINGQIVLTGKIESNGTLVIVDDWCVEEFAFIEAVRVIKKACPKAKISRHHLVIARASGLGTIPADGIGTFNVLSLFDMTTNVWVTGSCPLCADKSKTIKPLAHAHNWDELKSSHLD